MNGTIERAGEGAPVIETERLILRPWADEDREPFAALNGDPQVMRYFPSVLQRTESDAMVETARQRVLEDGFCFQPAAIKETGRFIGFVGLNRPRHALPFAPCVEVGWRLSRDAWGHGYASEAAQAWLRFGFETLGLEEIVSFTTVTNTPLPACDGADRHGAGRGGRFRSSRSRPGAPARSPCPLSAQGGSLAADADGRLNCPAIPS